MYNCPRCGRPTKQVGTGSVRRCTALPTQCRFRGPVAEKPPTLEEPGIDARHTLMVNADLLALQKPQDTGSHEDQIRRYKERQLEQKRSLKKHPLIEMIAAIANTMSPFRISAYNDKDSGAVLLSARDDDHVYVCGIPTEEIMKYFDRKEELERLIYTAVNEIHDCMNRAANRFY